MGYSKTAAVGAFWSGGYRVVNRGLAIIRTGILARILSPAQFGVYGVGALVLSLLETFTSTGINTFLIQENRDVKKYVDTAWVISILRGSVIAFLLIILAPLISSFFNNSESVTIIRLLSVTAFIKGFINPSRIIYEKNMLLKKEFFLSGGLLFIDSAVAITLSFLYRTPMAIAWGLLVSGLVEVMLSHVLLEPKPKLKLEKSQAKEIMGIGKWLLGTRISAYLYQEGDDIVVGKLLSSASLGLYQMAYKISTLPITEGLYVFQQVTFPIFTNIKGDKKRLMKAYFRSSLLVLLASMPFAILFIGFPEFVVNIVLGEQWLSIVPVLRILTVYGVIQSISATTNSLFYSLSKNNYVAYFTVANLLGMLMAIYPLVLKYGIFGAGLSVLVGALVSLPIRVYFLLKVAK